MPLKLSHGMGAWIKDFQKSDAPQFKGKSSKERRDQAVAAYMSAKRDAKENYVSHAQRKAVWASRADGGKGHPDNKKKNESVHSADKKPEKYIDNKGITKTRMVPTDRNVVKNEAAEYDSGWKKSPKDRKDQYGNPVKAKNVPKQLAKMGMKQHDKDDKKKNENVEEGGLWANIHAKRKRIKNGSGERMRKPGSKGAPTDKDFKDAQESVQYKTFFELREAAKCYDDDDKEEKESKGYKPGWMLKADPKLKAKVDAAKAKHKEFKKLVGTKKESTEQIDELSKDTLTKYRSAAWKDKEDAEMNRGAGDFSQRYAAVVRYHKRKDGALGASKRIGQIDRGERKNEQVEHIEEDMKSAAKEMHGYASKHGGMDKADFHKAAKHMEAGNHKALHNLIKKLDSDPRDKILTTLHKHGNDIKRYGYSTEEVEIDEATNDDIETTRQFRHAIALAKAQKAIRQAKDGKGAKYYADGTKVTPAEVAHRSAERKAKKQYGDKMESDASWEKAQEKEKEKKLTTKDQKTLSQLRALMNKEKK